MQKKFRISLQGALDSLLCRRMNRTPNFASAKKLYFKNFANYTTMRKNGEYDEYHRFHVPADKEYAWSEEVKDLLIEKIVNESAPLEVINLSRVNLPENEIEDAFRSLSLSPKSSEILEAIELLKPLFEPGWYERIVLFFK